jgi:hypothetical protein
VLLETEDPKNAPGSDPEALIEEARERQRQRARRRNVAVQAAALLVILGFGISQLARGGANTQPAPQRPPTSAAHPPTVTYEKIMAQKFVPHLPSETQTIETWSSSATPGTQRQVITISGGQRVEIGIILVRDQVLGPEKVNYLYDASTNTIYRTGYVLARTLEQPTPGQFFKQVLANPVSHLEGTRTYRGRSVYVVVLTPGAGARQTFSFDKSTHEVVRNVVTGTDIRTVVHTLVHRTLPGTNANLALTSLPAAHPHARTVLQAPPRIKQLFGEAFYPSGAYGD